MARGLASLMVLASMTLAVGCGSEEDEAETEQGGDRARPGANGTRYHLAWSRRIGLTGAP